MASGGSAGTPQPDSDTASFLTLREASARCIQRPHLVPLETGQGKKRSGACCEAIFVLFFFNGRGKGEG